MSASSGKGEDSGPVGRTLRHYRVVEVLGRGGMGVVYRAEDLQLGRQVALKALPPELAENEDRLARFRREARSLAALNHPNIVTLYAVEEIDGQVFLAMELVEGRSLGQVVPAAGLELPQFFALAIPLVEALSAAHERGIVHRDLKPGNVLVTAQGRVKVLDFGLAKLRADASDPGATTHLPSAVHTAIGGVAGTPAYMAPEQIRGSPADERSDIFAVGLVLYQMISGQHPFLGASSADVVSSILRDDPPSLSERKPRLPRQLERIIRSCLEKDPERRLQTAKDLRNQLASLQAELASGVASMAYPVARRRRWRPAASVAAAAGLALVLALWLADRRSGPAEPPRLPYLAVREARLFSGQLGPQYFRRGLVEAFGERLAGLSGAWIVPPGGDPRPDLVVEADVQRLPEMVTLQVRLQDRRHGRSLGSEIFEGSAGEPFALLDRAGAAVADFLGAQPGLTVRYRVGRVPTRDAGAFDLYLRARDAEATPERALALARRAREKDPRFASAWVLEGELQRQRHLVTRRPASLEAAARACREGVAIDDELAAGHLCLARVERARQRLLAAEAEFVRAIELDPGSLAAHQGLRGVYDALGQPSRGERTWKQIIELNPGHWAGHWSLGGFYLATERHEEAVEQFQRSLALAPNNAFAHLTLGAAYYDLGRYEDAIRSYRRSIAVAPNHRAYTNLGTLYVLLRRFPEGVESLERAARFPEAEETVFGNLATAYYWAPGRREEAAAVFERTVQLCRRHLAEDPESPGAWLWLAYSQAALGRENESRAALREVLERHPNVPHYLYFAARIFNRLGEPREALDALEQAVKGGHSMAEARFDAEFDNLRDEPRFQALLGEV